jgi:hypothetical protein
MTNDNEEKKYFIREEKLFEDDPEAGVRQLIHIKRLNVEGWSGSYEVWINGDIVELWLDKDLNEYLASDDDYEPSYDVLHHKLSIDGRGLLEGFINCLYVYIFVYLDEKGSITDDVSNGCNLYENKRYVTNPLFKRLNSLLHVGYVVDENYLPPNARSGPVVITSIEFKYPSGRGVQLHLDGSLREAQWSQYSTNIFEKTSDGWIKKIDNNTWEKVKEGDLYIPPDDLVAFRDFLDTVRKPEIEMPKKPKFWKW